MLPSLHQLPLKPTGAYSTGANARDAGSDAKALKDAATDLTTGNGGIEGQFPNVYAQMKHISTRAKADAEYLAQLRQKVDYQFAISHIADHVLGNDNVAPYYEMQEKVVRFMYLTADRMVMANIKERLAHSTDGPVVMEGPFRGYYNERGALRLQSLLWRFGEVAMTENGPLYTMVDELSGMIDPQRMGGGGGVGGPSSAARSRKRSR